MRFSYDHFNYIVHPLCDTIKQHNIHVHNVIICYLYVLSNTSSQRQAQSVENCRVKGSYLTGSIKLSSCGLILDEALSLVQPTVTADSCEEVVSRL